MKVYTLTVTGESINTEFSFQSDSFTPMLKFGNSNLSLTTKTYRSEMSNDNDQQEKPKEWQGLIKIPCMKIRESRCA